MILLPSEVKAAEQDIKMRIYLGMLVSFACGFVLAGLLISMGVITV
jgi:hypothetical protein